MLMRLSASAFCLLIFTTLWYSECLLQFLWINTAAEPSNLLRMSSKKRCLTASILSYKMTFKSNLGLKNREDPGRF